MPAGWELPRKQFSHNTVLCDLPVTLGRVLLIFSSGCVSDSLRAQQCRSMLYRNGLQSVLSLIFNNEGPMALFVLCPC